MEQFLKYFPLVKVDEATHAAFGICTAEVPDKDGEICDYADTKPEYEAWSNEALTSTSAAGQEPSMGNIRLQHDSGTIAGKAIGLQFNDAKKQIWLEAVPVNDDIWAMLKGGFIRGYSHAGRYIYRRCDVCKTDMPSTGNFCPTCGRDVPVRYAAKISEVSFVDNPCLGVAHFTYVKSDRSAELRKFADARSDERPTEKQPTEKAGAEAKPADPKTAKAEAAPDDLGAVVVTNGGSMSQVPAVAPHAALLKAAPQFSVLLARMKQFGLGPDGTAEKSMYSIGEFASLLQDIKYLQYGCMYEAQWEDDPRDAALAEDLGDWLTDGAGILRDMVEEETSELTASPADSTTKGAQAQMEKMENELAKGAKGMAGHFKKAADHSEKMADLHEKTAKSHEALAEVHESIADASDGPVAKENKTAAVAHKALAKSEMSKAVALKAYAGHCDKMATQCEEGSEKAVDIADLVKSALTEANAPLIEAIKSFKIEIPAVTPAAAVAEKTEAVSADGVQKSAPAAAPTKDDLDAMIKAAVEAHDNAKLQKTTVTLVPPAGNKSDGFNSSVNVGGIADAGL